MVTALASGRNPFDSASEGQGLVSRSSAKQKLYFPEWPNVLLSISCEMEPVEVGLYQIDGPADGGVGPVSIPEEVDPLIHADAGGVGTADHDQVGDPVG